MCEITGKIYDAVLELDAAFCQFCNNVDDPLPDVPLWTETVRQDFTRLCIAYEVWANLMREEHGS